MCCDCVCITVLSTTWSAAHSIQNCCQEMVTTLIWLSHWMIAQTLSINRLHGHWYLNMLRTSQKHIYHSVHVSLLNLTTSNPIPQECDFNSNCNYSVVHVQVWQAFTPQMNQLVIADIHEILFWFIFLSTWLLVLQLDLQTSRVLTLTISVPTHSTFWT